MKKHGTHGKRRHAPSVERAALRGVALALYVASASAIPACAESTTMAPSAKTPITISFLNDPRTFHIPFGFLFPGHVPAPTFISQPHQLRMLSFEFWYPDLRYVEVGAGGGLRPQEPGRPRPTNDQFIVQVSIMVASPDAQARLPADKNTLLYLRPSQMLANYSKHVSRYFKRQPTPYPGLDRLAYQDDKGHSTPAWAYVQKPGSDDDIFIDCQVHSCEADIFIHKTQFQYRFRFPIEKLSETAGMIQALTSLHERWLDKP